MKFIIKEWKKYLSEYSVIKAQEETGEIVSVVLINKRNEVLLLKRSLKSKSNPGLWGLPGGHIKNGETPQEALIREVVEETSVIMKDFDFAIHDYEKNTHYFISDKFSGNVVLNYEHTDYAWVEPIRIDSEHTIKHLKKRIMQSIEIHRSNSRTSNE
jgi:mutator protein MutT